MPSIAGVLLQQASVLIGLCTLQWFVARRWPVEKPTGEIAAGVVFGLAGIVAMIDPVVLAPGVFVDNRTVVVSISAIFAGWRGALVTSLPLATLRLATGGAGVAIGTTAIFAAVAFGLTYRNRFAAAPPRRIRFGSAAAFTAIGYAIMTGVLYLLPRLGAIPEPVPNQSLAGFFAIAFGATLVMGLVIQEIYASVAAERALVDRDRTLEALMAALPDTLIRMHEDGRYIDVRGGAGDRLPYDPATIGGRHLSEVVDARTAEHVMAAIHRALATGRRQALTYRRRAGPRPSWFRAHIVPYREPGSDQRSVFAITRNIDAFVEAQNRLTEALKAAERANAAKDHFLANMSHDLRTPLNAVLGFTEIMRQQLLGRFETEAYREYAEHIHASGSLLVSLIDDILDVSRIESGEYPLERRATPVADIIRTSVAMLAIRADAKRQELVVEPGPADLNLLVDRRALVQVLNNLLSNAIKFTPWSGRITVSATTDWSGWCRLAVADTGRGMSAEAIAQAPEPFRQFSGDPPAGNAGGQSDKGTGLGLYITHRLVALHGGRVEIDSALDHGTVVTLVLPTSAASVEECGAGSDPSVS